MSPAALDHLVIMGVAGAGKTTLALELQRRLGRPYAEADDLHPAANIAKMRAGEPLTDADRAPWLERLAAWITAREAEGSSSIVTCSALRRAYRDRLAAAAPRVRFVHVVADEGELARRLEHRAGHFMPATLLTSQLATLEDLQDDEDGVRVPTASTARATADRALHLLGLEPGAPA